MTLEAIIQVEKEALTTQLKEALEGLRGRAEADGGEMAKSEIELVNKVFSAVLAAPVKP